MVDIDKIKLFPATKVVIAGDIIADQFLNGTISRVSREAPVFILRHDDTSTVPGGAANAAMNVASLGGRIELVGIVGDDATGSALLTTLSKARVDTSHIHSAAGRQTTRKVRVLAGQSYAPRQQVIRIDYEETGDLGDDARSAVLKHLADAAADAHALVISDYGCGAVFPELFQNASAIAATRSIPLIVDSRFRLATFAGATTATPNREEVEQLLGAGFKAADCSRLREQLGLKALLVTNGNDGVSLYMGNSEPHHLDAVGSRQPVDVTGAGDTVIAAYALALAAGLSFLDAAAVANTAGGIAVMKPGTATVSATELKSGLVAQKGVAADVSR